MGERNSRQELALLTRDKILDAAVMVFSRKGYHGASVDDIVAESGTSKGAVYFHFANKEEVFTELVARMSEMLWDAINGHLSGQGTPASKITKALRAGLEVFEANRELARIALIEVAALGPAVEEKRMKVREAFVDLIRMHLEELVREGGIAPLDASVAACAFFGTINETVVRWLVRGEPPSLLGCVEELAAYNLRGIGLEPRKA